MKVKPGIALFLLSVPVLLWFASNSYLATANPRPHPTHGCSAKTTVGKYVVICNGFLSPGLNAPLLPAKLLATIVSEDGDRIDGLVVDPGTVFSCELRRTSKGD